MATKPSRSARITTSKTTTEVLVDAAKNSDINRIIPLNDGKNAYLRDPITFETVQYSTGSPEFYAALRAQFDLGLGQRLHEELVALAETGVGDNWMSCLFHMEQQEEPVSEAVG